MNRIERLAAVLLLLQERPYTEVLAPLELRQKMAQLGQQLLDQYLKR